ncbi:hypothetical protein L9F63_005789, partial [Diploptera punctata]
VDRRQIAEVQLVDETMELQTLGLSVYNQDTLEQGILHQVDQALEELDRRKLELQINAVADDILLEYLNCIRKMGQEENERDRKIRLGEMTPFGNALGDETPTTIRSNEGLTEFEKYLQRRKRRNLVHILVMSGEIRSHSLVPTVEGGKKLTLSMIRDHKKKPGKLVSEETALDDSEGSEYLPSESEIEEVKKEDIRKKQFYQDSEEWGTDDSDWEYSDEESRAKRRRSTKKEIDDGNIEDYHERLKFWEEQKARQPEEENTGYHEMEGGYKIHKNLWTKLYNYQKVGVQWMWELNQQRCGGILGDEMGLGKTVQIIAFLAGLSHSKLVSRHGNFRGLGPTLIICPTTVMHQWVREFHVWWPQFRVAVLHESGSFHGKRESLISHMNQVGCVLVTSYVGVVQHQDALKSKDWHYVILDEGHKIRNPDAQVTLAVKQFKTPHRLILSGSPMQNNLKELWSLFDFIFPGKLGTLPVFLAQMAVPITQGGYSNASEVQVATAYRCAMVLRDTIAPYLLRRMKTDVKSHICLPPKNEQVLFCRLTEEQKILYKSYLDSGEVERILQGRFQIFVGLIALRKICNHPDLYSGGPKLLRGENEEDLPEEARYGYWKKAGKMLVVESLLSIWYKQKHRVLLFTQSRQMLCILEAFVQKKGYKYLKLDGGTGVASRQPLINKFNEDISYFVFLLTTRVGGLGVNLTGADRVVIYDPDWNPATDTQARERAWRIGQQNNVTVYRLITAGTIEEKIYHRQIFKQFLCNKVLRDPRQRRFFKSNDLLELFTLAESERTTETAAIFAGTGSEVKLSSTKAKSDKVKLSYKKSTDSKQSKSKVKVKETVKFSESKVKRDFNGHGTEESEMRIPSCESSENYKSSVSSTSSPSEEEVRQNSLNLKQSGCVRSVKKKHKHHKKKKSRKKEKGIKFEGERVPYLVGQTETQTQQSEDEHSSAQHDDYVLRKLFKKSGIQTAMRHDTIMEGGDADYALVEGEAKRVAKEAIQALKESRSQCWQANSGVPSWTGQSGAIRLPKVTSNQIKLKFGKKMPVQRTSIKPSSVKESSDLPMSSSELLTRMRSRNHLLEPISENPEQTERQHDTQEENDPSPSSSTSAPSSAFIQEEHMELLTDIRNFISFGASVDGRASTQEILAKFRERLPPGSSPLFKFMLSEICEFHRLPSGEGIWKLRTEFRW